MMETEDLNDERELLPQLLQPTSILEEHDFLEDANEQRNNAELLLNSNDGDNSNSIEESENFEECPRKRRKVGPTEADTECQNKRKRNSSAKQGTEQDKRLTDSVSLIPNQNEFEKCLRILNAGVANLESKFEEVIAILLAQNKIIIENKILCKKTNCTLDRLTTDDIGKLANRKEEEAVLDENVPDISFMFPIDTIEAMKQLEEKLQDQSFEISLKNYLLKLKRSSRSIDGVLRKIITDDCAYFYNMDGKCGRKSFMNLKLINKTLFELYKREGKQKFMEDCRIYLKKGKTRFNMKLHHLRKVVPDSDDNKMVFY